MKQKTWLVGAIWGAALTAAVFLYMHRKNDPAAATELVVHTPRTALAPDRPASRPQSPPPAPGPVKMFRITPRHDSRSAFGAPSSPTVAWKTPTGGPISGQPVVDDDGTIYVGSDDDAVYSFTPAGELRWKLLARGDADTGITPTPGGELVIAAGHDLWCLTTDGRAKWRFEAQGKIFSTPAVDADGTIVFGAQDDSVYALAPDGRMRWSYRTQGDVDSTVLLDDAGNVYVGSDDKHVYALTRDGQLRWSIELPSFVRAPLSIAADGSVLATTFGPEPELVALDPADGRVRFRFATTAVPSKDVGIVSGALVDRSGTIVFGAQDDYLYALTPSGELRWVFRAEGDIDSTPVLTPQGVLLFGADDGYLYALR